MRSHLVVFSSGLLFILPLPSIAATRPCLDVIITFGTDPASELEARKKALVAWGNEARKHGEAFAAWRLAWQKTLECGLMPKGGFQCRAVGKPCGISHVPGNLPPGSAPVPRPKPGAA